MSGYGSSLRAREAHPIREAGWTGTFSPCFQPGIPAGLRKLLLENRLCSQETSVLSNCQGSTVWGGFFFVFCLVGWFWWLLLFLFGFFFFCFP